MTSPLAGLFQDLPLTGDIPTDVFLLLTHHGCARTVAHSSKVAAEASRLAQQWGEDSIDAETAGWLHDISAIVPPAQRVALAEAWQIDILPEERAFPMILHQKLSAAIARESFGVSNLAVLSAIGCHTTLKANASPLDKIVFVADKLKWDQEGDPPYLDALADAAEQSLDAAAFCYLETLWQHRSSLPILHPWMIEAYQQLLKE
jgi:predicted HD superfamily hydrolase involved in NAD metabolism